MGGTTVLTVLNSTEYRINSTSNVPNVHFIKTYAHFHNSGLTQHRCTFTLEIQNNVSKDERQEPIKNDIKSSGSSVNQPKKIFFRWYISDWIIQHGLGIFKCKKSEMYRHFLAGPSFPRRINRLSSFHSHSHKYCKYFSLSHTSKIWNFQLFWWPSHSLNAQQAPAISSKRWTIRFLTGQCHIIGKWEQ